MTVRFAEMWETVAVTALPPGWRNVYKHDDGDTASACPAVLLQELRETVRYEDVTKADGTPRIKEEATRREPPYETRVVFADYGDGGLEPAGDMSNYVGTLAPGDPPKT